jgi:hypothetical protein
MVNQSQVPPDRINIFPYTNQRFSIDNENIDMGKANEMKKSITNFRTGGILKHPNGGKYGARPKGSIGPKVCAVKVRFDDNVTPLSFLKESEFKNDDDDTKIKGTPFPMLAHMPDLAPIMITSDVYVPPVNGPDFLAPTYFVFDSQKLEAEN